MALEGLINIRVYNSIGAIDSTLSGSVSVYDDSDNSLDATGSLTYNATTGHYQYDFTPLMNLSKTYTANIDFGVSALTRYISCSLSVGSTGGWLTTEEHNKLLSLENSTWGWGSINYQAINSHTTNKVNELKEEIAKIPNLSNIETQLNDIDSHIELAKNDTIDRIETVENEVCSDIIRKTKEIKEDNIKTRNLVRKKTKNLAEIAQKQLDSEVKTQKMIDDELEEIETLIEQNIDFEADEIERQIQEQIDKEINEIESNQSNDGNNNGTEGEIQGTQD